MLGFLLKKVAVKRSGGSGTLTCLRIFYTVLLPAESIFRNLLRLIANLPGTEHCRKLDSTSTWYFSTVHHTVVAVLMCFLISSVRCTVSVRHCKSNESFTDTVDRRP
jgi:hypothetical protein